MKNRFRIRLLTLSTFLYCVLTAASFMVYLFNSNQMFIYYTVIFNTLMLLSMFTIMLYLEADEDKPTRVLNFFGFLLAWPIVIFVLFANKVIQILRGGDDDE